MSKSTYPSLPVMVIDDEIQAIKSCELILNSGGIDHIISLTDSREVMESLQSSEPSVIMLDLSMPYLSGDNLLKTMTRDYPHIPVIIITGLNEVETAVNCIKSGAFDYLVKPVEKNRMISSVKRAIELRELRHQYNVLSKRMLSQELEHPEVFQDIVTSHPKMRNIFHYVEAIAATSKPVLITGETGVGKELIARAIHELSGRKGEFVALNVAGLDDNVFSDTLFGHSKGAFTGAEQSRSGIVEKAAGGALFLDEIGDLNISSQIKILRLIEEREYFPLGADVAKLTDARVITSTNKDLSTLLDKGLFRKDLFYRLRTHHIDIPPLRERFSDLPILLDHFLEKASYMLRKNKPTYPRELITLLFTYHFPGNVRELESMVFDAMSHYQSGQISMNSFKSYIGKSKLSVPMNNKILKEKAEFLYSDWESLPTLKESSHLLIAEALRRTRGNQSLAARMLGITQSALSKRLKRSAKTL